MNYRTRRTGRTWLKVSIVIVIIATLVTLTAVVAVRRAYHENLKPASTSQKALLVTIASGASVREIAGMLKAQGLIRSDWAFEWYVNSQDARDKLQAGSYSIRPSQDVQDIVAILSQGKIETDLVLIAPGRRLDEIRSALINKGFAATAVDSALNPAQYKNHPALVDKPEGVNLEGYLYPESFQKTANTKPERIIEQSLDEMHKQLTPDIRNKIVAQGLTVYQGIILASIIEKEVPSPEDRAQVAQVFLKRYRADIRLQSDATALYGAFLADQPPTVTYESAYNTYSHNGLPPTPISNVSASSLQAVANPAATDWLFFVSGDDGKTYFSKTIEEHEAFTRQHCKKLCNQ